MHHPLVPMQLCRQYDMPFCRTCEVKVQNCLYKQSRVWGTPTDMGIRRNRMITSTNTNLQSLSVH